MVPTSGTCAFTRWVPWIDRRYRCRRMVPRQPRCDRRDRLAAGGGGGFACAPRTACWASPSLPLPTSLRARVSLSHGFTRGRVRDSTGRAIAAAVRTRDDLPETYRVAWRWAWALVSAPTIRRRPSVECSSRRWLAHLSRRRPSRHPTSGSSRPRWTTARARPLGHVLSRLYDAGAREAHFLPRRHEEGQARPSDRGALRREGTYPCSSG